MRKCHDFDGAGIAARSRAAPARRLRWITALAIAAGPTIAGAQDAGITGPGLRAEGRPVQAGSTPPLERRQGSIVVDYQKIDISGFQPVDLLGVHFLNRFNDWLSLGVGLHAPLFKGEYGGFMAFDATLHAEHRLSENWTAMLGASVGGGGGGKSAEQSKVISGSGGFLKGYVGVGYRFNEQITLGVNWSLVRFTNSVIDGSQLGVFVQTPFSYGAAPYAASGRPRPAPGTTDVRGPGDELIIGLDNIYQLDPQASYRGNINLVDAQFNHFIDDRTYVLIGGSVGYHGLAAYNQAFGGVGYRHPLSDRMNVRLQLAVGSGGYAPDRIDTGSGLLIHPEVALHYRVSRDFSLALHAGYLHAPRGSSRNATLGAALVYHLDPDRSLAGVRDRPVAGSDTLRAYRFHLFAQTSFDTQVGDQDQGQIRMLSVQIDRALREPFYLPFQGSIAYNAYLGFPGYGELLAGIGVQTRHTPQRPLQAYAQLLVGTNVHGLIAKPAVGLDLALSDGLALYAQAGITRSFRQERLYPQRHRISATSIGVGLSYRFSI